ncbi:MAG: PilZ domain-containing protein [Desulfovibrionaceae bacterium]|nr:PilZ domain-containing protein [Desulfovibrionaceae bacterium]
MDSTSLIDQIRFFFATRTQTDYLIVGGIVLLIVVYYLVQYFKHYTHLLHLRKQRKIVHDMLDRAQLQNENFELQLGTGENKNNYSAVLANIGNDTLTFNVLLHVNKVLAETPAEIYFCVRYDHKRHFFKFRVPIIDIKYEKTTSIVYVKKPTNLDIGQKRTFFRITPLPNSVKLLALWLMDKDKPLPKTTAEVGTPLVSCSFHQDKVPAQNTLDVADISGSGIALRVPDDPLSDQQINIGSIILCLLVYNESFHGDEHLVNFCCTGRVTNIRELHDKKTKLPFKILGIEFTNWAMLESGNPNINWFHQAKATGIGPILQWVTRMDIEKRKGTPLSPTMAAERS